MYPSIVTKLLISYLVTENLKVETKNLMNFFELAFQPTQSWGLLELLRFVCCCQSCNLKKNVLKNKRF